MRIFDLSPGFSLSCVGTLVVGFAAACGSGSSSEGGGPGTATNDGGAASVATCNADTQSDPQNCGACGHGCLGGSCSKGLCSEVTLAKDVGGADAYLYVDGETSAYERWAFFTTQVNPGRTVSGASVTGSGKSGVVYNVPQGHEIGQPVTDDRNVYFSESYTTSTSVGYYVWRADRGGGQPTKLIDNHVGGLLRLDVSKQHLYFGDIGGGGIRVIDLTTGTAENVSRRTQTFFDVHSLDWTIDADGKGYFLTVDASSKGAVYSADLTTPGTLTPNKVADVDIANRSNNIVVDADSVYFYDSANAVVSVPKAGGAPKTIAAGVPTVLPGPSSTTLSGRSGLVLVDDKYVYWSVGEFSSISDGAVPSTSKLYRAPKDGSAANAPEVLLDAQPALELLAIDDKRLYLLRGTSLHRELIALAR